MAGPGTSTAKGYYGKQRAKKANKSKKTKRAK